MHFKIQINIRASLCSKNCFDSCFFFTGAYRTMLKNYEKKEKKLLWKFNLVTTGGKQQKHSPLTVILYAISRQLSAELWPFVRESETRNAYWWSRLLYTIIKQSLILSLQWLQGFLLKLLCSTERSKHQPRAPSH